MGVAWTCTLMAMFATHTLAFSSMQGAGMILRGNPVETSPAPIARVLQTASLSQRGCRRKHNPTPNGGSGGGLLMQHSTQEASMYAAPPTSTHAKSFRVDSCAAVQRGGARGISLLHDSRCNVQGRRMLQNTIAIDIPYVLLFRLGYCVSHPHGDTTLPQQGQHMEGPASLRRRRRGCQRFSLDRWRMVNLFPLKCCLCDPISVVNSVRVVCAFTALQIF